MTALDDRCSSLRGVPDVLAFCNRSGQYLPAEAINDRIEHLDCSALSFPNLTNDINLATRSWSLQEPPHTLAMSSYTRLFPMLGGKGPRLTAIPTAPTPARRRGRGRHRSGGRRRNR